MESKLRVADPIHALPFTVRSPFAGGGRPQRPNPSLAFSGLPTDRRDPSLDFYGPQRPKGA